jgi:RNA polymerase sigma-70 factor, ECF subfamily
VTSSPPANAASDSPRFRAIFDGEFKYVWNTLRRLGVRPADLEDVTHDVFLRLYRRMDDFDPARPLRPWVFGFAYRTAADHRKLARHRREVITDSDRAIDSSPAADEQLAELDQRALFERALDALTLEQRAVFVLHEIDEQPIAQIAIALDLPANTAWSRLRAARAEFAAAAKRIALQRRTRHE